MTVQTINVSSAAGLLSALAAATGGETIQLAPGNYGDLVVRDKQFAQDVTLTGGIFSSVALVSTSHIHFDRTAVLFAPSMSSTSNSPGVRIDRSSDIAFTNSTVTGGPSVNGVPYESTALDATGNVIGLPVGKGITITSSTNVMIANNDVSKFDKGIVFAVSDVVSVVGNQVHDLRTSGILGSGGAGLVITGNHVWNSNPWSYGGAGDHGDRIIVWTDKIPVTGLVISDNLLEQGTGAALLGIYLDDNGKGLGFKDVTISGNTLRDGQGQGVLLENVSGAIERNALVWSGYGDAVTNTPRFDIKASSHDLAFTDNLGPVSIRAGAHDINFLRQTGMISEDAAMTSADRDTITIDFMVITAHNSYTLNATTSDLYFEGGIGDFVGTGNALANHIVGGTGNDTLSGNGGSDVLEGNYGNDTYYVDNKNQIIIDSSGISDSVYSSVSWKLQYGLENLYYTGTAGATLEGNDQNNRITGGSGDDTLISGRGNDVLEGGLGNDTYVLTGSGHTIVDSGGIDTVVSAVSYTLGASIENLTLSGTAVSAYGNAQNNVIYGNGASNTLDGKTGADSMYGGAGDDIYLVDNTGDKTYEVVGLVDSGGIDTVKTGLTAWTLASGVENLTYTGSVAFAGTGNTLANTITGGAAIDTLNGGGGDDKLIGNAGDDKLNGGAGIDTLTGGTGNDSFIFVKGEANGDAITDFNGRGTSVGDVIEVRGWGVGTTVSNIAGTNFWVINDGLDGFAEHIRAQSVDASDWVFTQIVAAPVVGTTAATTMSALVVDTQGIDLLAVVSNNEVDLDQPANVDAVGIFEDDGGNLDAFPDAAPTDSDLPAPVFEARDGDGREPNYSDFGIGGAGHHFTPVNEHYLAHHIA